MGCMDAWKAGLVYLPAGAGKEILPYGEGRDLRGSNCLGHSVMDCPPQSPEDSLTSCKLFSNVAPGVMPSDVSVSLSPAGLCSARVHVARATLLQARGQQPRCRRWVRAGGSGVTAPEEAILTLALFPWHLAGLRTPSFWGGCRETGSIIAPAGGGREIYIPGREQP